MISEKKLVEVDKLLKTLLQKSWSNSEFKHKLIDDPKEVISKEIGKEFILPNNRQMVVEDQSDSNIIYINIPARFDIDEFELSDEQLELVSGGELGIGIAVGAAFLVGVAIGYYS